MENNTYQILGTLTIAYGIINFIILSILVYIPEITRKSKQKKISNSVMVGDGIITDSGFYGKVVQIENEVFIVEFGNDAHCRIPISKDSIVQVYKEQHYSTSDYFSDYGPVRNNYQNNDWKNL